MTGGMHNENSAVEAIGRLEADLAEYHQHGVFTPLPADLRIALDQIRQLREALEPFAALADFDAARKASTAPEAGAVGTTEGREPQSPTTREGADR